MYALDAAPLDAVTVMREAFAAVPTLTRAITDLTLPPLPAGVSSVRAGQRRPLTTLDPAPGTDRPKTELEEAAPPTAWRRDLWTANSLLALEQAKKAASVETRASLDTAETLLSHFAMLPAPVRPQLAFNDDGQPVFGASRGGFYLDLTIDSPDKLTWYAVVNDREYFAEEVEYTGRQLPKDLRSVFAMRVP